MRQFTRHVFGGVDHAGAHRQRHCQRLQHVAVSGFTTQFDVLIDGVEEEADGVPVAELRAKRDDMLVAVLEALAKERG